MTVRDAFCILAEGGKATGDLHHVGLDGALGALRKDQCLDLLRGYAQGSITACNMGKPFSGPEAGGVWCRDGILETQHN